MPYWINSTLAALPSVLWVYVGLGLPWALALLPRKDWRDRALAACLALAFGPALLTAWMFALGTVGGAQARPLLRFDLIIGGTVVLAAAGALLAWRVYTISPPTHAVEGEAPLAIDEKLLIVLIIVAVAIRWLTTAYWPFTAYDELWVYGYEGRLYTLLGYIPQRIGYYPQFMPLQYTYAQLAVGGVDDHAARAVIPFLHVGSILAVYALGARLFNRRAGIIAAALWALYPHMGEWAHVGDLEIAQTFLLTATAAFFFMAWTGQEPRRRYALIGGFLFGTALWTKPTAGAFVWGIALLAAVEIARVIASLHGRGVRLNAPTPTQWRPRLEVAFITGLACIPLGGVWYARNILLGHPPVVLPIASWLALAQRSGAEFGWPLLAVVLLVGYVWRRQPLPPSPSPYTERGREADAARGADDVGVLHGVSSRVDTGRKWLLIGLGLVLAGMLPSVIASHRMGLLEWAAFATGGVILYSALRQYARQRWTDGSRTIAARLGWMQALALPYFVTWFYSYSYHYRLSFPIVPLMLMPSAVILSHWIKPEAMPRARRLVYLAAIALVALPGVVITLHDEAGGWDWLWTDKYPDDYQRYASENPSLMINVAAIQDWVRANGRQPVIMAPGGQLFPFFFPLADIHVDDTPDRLAQLAGFTHYIYSKHASWWYGAAGIAPEANQIVSALARDDILHRVAAHDDGNFFYETYEIHVDRRFTMPELSYILPDEVIFGGFVRYVGANLHSTVFQGGNRILYEIVWQVIEPPPDDYMLYLHLTREGDRDTVYAAWDGPAAKGEHGYYSTRLWEPGEYILDRRWLQLPDRDTPRGQDYRVIVGMYSLKDNQRVPISIDGNPAGDGFDMRGNFEVR